MNVKTQFRQIRPYCEFFPAADSGTNCPPLFHNAPVELAIIWAVSPFKYIRWHVNLCPWFVLGLFKMVVLADNFEIFATAAFVAAEHGEAIHFLEAWGASLAYSFQTYFEFSGYSDMAIGLARMFGSETTNELFLAI